MENQVDNKTFTWVVKNFCFHLPFKYISSDTFVIDDCKWFLTAYHSRRHSGYLSLYLHVEFSFRVVNQFDDIFSQRLETTRWFDKYATGVGFPQVLCLHKLQEKNGGFMVNGAVKIVAEVDVIQVIGKLDVSEESKEITKPLKNLKINDDCAVDVHGFQVLPSQVELVKRMFEKYPDFASEVRSKKRHLTSTYINVLLGVIDTLCQLPEELSDDDLDEASVAISYVGKGGFELDWLEKKLEEVKAKKKKVDTGKAWLQKLEKDLQKYYHKCLHLKALIEKENADVLAANVSFSFADVV